MVAKEVARIGLSFCCLQEVKYRNSGNKLIELDNGEKYEFYWCGKKKRREAGVGFLIKVDPNIIIKDYNMLDPRIITMNLMVHGFNLKIVNIYAPTNADDNENLKDLFYKNLQKVCQKTEKHQKIIVAGDFNANTSLAYQKCHYNGRNVIEDDECNENGRRLKSLCRSKHLCISSTYFEYPEENRYTWYSPDNRTKKVNDYVLTEEYIQQYVNDCIVRPELDFDTDHRILITSLCTPTTRKARRKPNCRKTNKALNFEALEDAATEMKFQQELNSHLNNKNKEFQTVDEKARFIENTLKSAAQRTLPPVKNKTGCWEVWKQDEELNRLLQYRQETDRSSIQYKRLNKSIRKRVNTLRNEKLQKEADEINEYASRREVEQLYKNMKSNHTAFKDVQKTNQCDPAKLKEHFKKHFNITTTQEPPIELQDAPPFIEQLQRINYEDIKSGAPDLTEICSTITSLKNGKAATDVPSVYLKSAIKNKKFQNEIVKLYETVWKTNKIPSQWGHTKLVTIWKGASKGSCRDPEAYRGIQIGSTLCKIMIIIIINRLKKWYEQQLLDQQQGFRMGRGTTDGIFIVKRMHQITNQMKKPVYALFIDLTAAFDHIERKWMFKSIHKRVQTKADSKLIQLLESLYTYTTTALAQSPEDIFELILGVRQGGPESPMLYNLYMDYVIRIFLNTCKAKKIKFLNLKYQIPSSATTEHKIKCGESQTDWVGYADDLILAFEDTKSMQRALDLLSTIFERYHLTLNTSKTKSMILNQQYVKSKYPESIAIVNGKSIENVKLFKYLGCQIKFDEPSTGKTELELRIDLAECKFYELGKKLLNFKIMLKTRAKIFNALVRSRLIYACQTWSLTKAQLQHVNSSYMSMIRKMVRGGYRRKENSYKYVLSNKELLEKCDIESLDVFIARQQRNYLAHLIRKPDTSTLKQLVFNNNKSKKQGRKISLYKTVIENEKTTPDLFNRNAIDRLY